MVCCFYVINKNAKEVINIIHKIRQVECMAGTHTEGKLRGRTEGSSKEAEESREEPCKLCKVVWPLSQTLCNTSQANKFVRWPMQEQRLYRPCQVSHFLVLMCENTFCSKLPSNYPK